MDTLIAEAFARTTASPSAVFAQWADTATWPEWDAGTEWVHLDGEFAEGARGVLKPRGGPKVSFVIDRLVPEHQFVDTTSLLGARLTFHHEVSAHEEGGSGIHVAISMVGPLRRVWARILGTGLRRDLQPSLDQLAHRAAEAP